MDFFIVFLVNIYDVYIMYRLFADGTCAQNDVHAARNAMARYVRKRDKHYARISVHPAGAYMLSAAEKAV